MTREEIAIRIDRILVEGFEVDAAAIGPEARLGDDLGLDSLDAVDLVVAIEKAFGCRIREADARNMRAMKDVYDYIERWNGGAAKAVVP
ncbi:MAG TPA: acyl carrier protein [Candidatus Hydrogenedentes bacterium]|nr:acyl carrier protein [Candidatus Hydrogenedentota bacterium]HOS03323.1 acyl carrier protein [Candidatus Hydrogenedentota bacterium]